MALADTGCRTAAAAGSARHKAAVANMHRVAEDAPAAAGKAARHPDGRDLDTDRAVDRAAVAAAETAVAGQAYGVQGLSLPKGEASRNSAAAPSVVFCSS